MKSNKKVGLIGVGEISKHHLFALKEIGVAVTLCVGRKGTGQASKFAEQFGVPSVCEDLDEVCERANELDGLIIATPPHVTPKITNKCLPLAKPLLIEKPVSLESRTIAELMQAAEGPVLIGFNRRYYSTIQKAKQFVDNSKRNVRVVMELPEKVRPDDKTPFFDVLSNSIHGLDILRFICGPLELENVQNTGKYFGRTASLRSLRGHTITMVMNWNAPTNFSLRIDNGAQLFDLCPFETCRVYQGLSVVEPTEDYPLRSYVPKLKEKWNVFDNSQKTLKPGFLGQAKDFSRLLHGASVEFGANMEDAFVTQTLVEKILA